MLQIFHVLLIFSLIQQVLSFSSFFSLSLCLSVIFSLHHCREQEMRLEKQRATQRYITEFKRKREEWKRMERMRLEEENRKILEFANTQQVREQERMEKQKEREQNKSEVQRQVSDISGVVSTTIGQFIVIFCCFSFHSLQTKLPSNTKTKKSRNESFWSCTWKNKRKLKEKKKRFVVLSKDHCASVSLFNTLILFQAEMERKLRQRIELQQTHAEQMQFKKMRMQAEMQEEEEFRR